MKNFTLLMIAIVFMSLQAFSQNTYLKIILDTKQLAPNWGLGGGGGLPATATKVYAHLGLCTCSMNGVGVTATRDCSNESQNEMYCLTQITPYRSNVWQHVVGNWGDAPQDDGVGLMTADSNGIYHIEFIIEEYFGNPSLVSTESAGDSVVPSTPWNPSLGGAAYTMGMVFRNEDGTLSGRDDNGKDLFIINMTGNNPEVIQSSQTSVPFNAITFEIHEASIEENDRLGSMAGVYPNPFKEQLYINFVMKEATKNLNVSIYNALGQEVRHLYSGMKSIGRHQLKWNGCNDQGRILSNGLYIVRITAGDKVVLTDRAILYR